MKSFDGRIKSLEHDPNVSLKQFCDRTSSLEHDFYKAIKRILENDDKKQNVSSVQIAIEHGIIEK